MIHTIAIAYTLNVTAYPYCLSIFSIINGSPRPQIPLEPNLRIKLVKVEKD